MARLFGLISAKEVDVAVAFPPHTGTRTATHGWGIAWYDPSNHVHVQKGKRTTLTANQPITLTANTHLFVSHMRVATSGSVHDTNAHPFTYKNCVFAHNGTIHKEKLLALLKPPSSEKFESEPIDSEVFFRFIIQSVQEKGEINGFRTALSMANDPRGTNFLLSDGQTLYAYCFGLPLYWLRWRDQQPLTMHSLKTEAQYQSFGLSTTPAFIIASERLTSGAWMAFDDGELLIVRKNLQYETIRM